MAEDRDNWISFYSFIIPFVLLGITIGILLIQPSVVGYNQAASDTFYSFSENSRVTQPITELEDPKILFYIQPTDRLSAIKYPVRITVQNLDTNNVKTYQCNPITLLFSHKCYINLPIKSDTNNSSWEFTFTTDAPDGVYGIWGAEENTTTAGSIKINGIEKSGPLEFVTFRSIYKDLDINLILTRSAILFGFSLVHIYLGRGLATIILPYTTLKKNEEITLWLFLGLIADIIVLAIFMLFHIPFAYFPLIIFGTIIVSQLVQIIKKQSSSGRNFFFSYWSQSEKNFVVIFIIVHILGALQLYQAETPLWIDGIFHNDILTKMVEENKVFLNTTYPIGFHLIGLANLLIWKMTTFESILLTGQWIIILSYLSFFLFSKSISTSNSNPWLSTILLIFLSPFPSYLINWSRFPFALGLALLPLVLYLTPFIFKSRKYILPVSLFILLCGMTHYGIFIILISGFMALLIRFLQESQNKKQKSQTIRIIFLLFLVLLPVIIFLAYHLRETIITQSLSELVEQSIANANSTDFGYVFGLLVSKGGFVIFPLSFIGLIFSFKFSNKVGTYLLIWLAIVSISIIFQIVFLGTLVSSLVDIFYFSLMPCCVLAGLTIERLGYRIISLILEKNLF